MIYQGDTIPLVFTVDTATPKIKAAIGSSDGKDLYEQFAFPSENGYSPLSTTDNLTFSGVLNANATRAARTGTAIVDVKLFDANGNSMTGESEPFEVKQSYLSDAD